jgi:steroid delta-isomerase-like uncharacterized protein
LVRRYYEIAARGDLEMLTQVVSPDLVIHTAPPGEGSSLESLRHTLATARAGLPDFAFRIDDLIVAGDAVAVRTTVQGTHLGEFFGAPPTGKRLEIAAVDIWSVEDDKLAENWHLEDILGVMEQLSAPSTGESGATPTPANPVAIQPSPVSEYGAAASAASGEASTELFGRGDLGAADGLLAPGFVWHGTASMGVARLQEHAIALRAAFPDLTPTVDRVVAEGDRVAVLWTLSGTHLGDYREVPATGNRVSTSGIDIYRIENGKIAEAWTVGDDLGLLMQLGADRRGNGDPAA